MIYREWLVMRKAVPIYLAVIIAMFVLVSLTGHVKTTFVQCLTAGAWFGALFASLFGVALGNSSRDGARVFWVLPKQRWQNGLGIVVVDLLATLLVTASITLATGAIDSAFATMPGNAMLWNFDGNAASLTVALPVAVYAWAALVGVIGRRLPYVGVAVMPVLVLWFGFAQSSGAIGNILRAPIALNPFAMYIAAHAAGGAKSHTEGGLAAALAWVTPEAALITLCLIAVTGCAAAIMMWSKSEVLA